MESYAAARAAKTVDGNRSRNRVVVLLKTLVGVMIACTLILTFTVSDYYIFNKISEYGFLFCLSQWVKKGGVILLTLAVFFNCRRCGEAAKYMLPLFIILSCVTFGDFFNIEAPLTDGDINREIFNSVNDFFPKWLNVALFIVQAASMMLCCGLLFYRDGYKINLKALWAIPLSLLAALPLNIFENFFDINDISEDNFFRFYNFTIWHFLALCVLFFATLGTYRFLKNKTREQQDKYLAAIAVTLLLQYHSKDSVVMGDGYNVYYTVFACLPLFICNIGVYVASISVMLKKRILYAITFFIHAVGALSVFIYFGKNSMSNYGIIINYSILFFCLTHCLLFILCLMPTALGHYKFRFKDCVIPLIYYFIVLAIACVMSGIVSQISTTWTTADGEYLVYDGLIVTGSVDGSYTLGGRGFMRPNYAFTQVNPFPFEVPDILPMGGFMKYINVTYVLLLYLFYVAMFFAFYGLYAAYLSIYKKVCAKRALKEGANALPLPGAVAEMAAANGEDEDLSRKAAAQENND